MAFGGSYLIVLRESLEAFLILGILTGMTTKLGHPEGRRPLYQGALVGLVLSIVLGIGISLGAEELFEAGEEGFEGIASLFAVAVLREGIETVLFIGT